MHVQIFLTTINLILNVLSLFSIGLLLVILAFVLLKELEVFYQFRSQIPF